MYLVDMLLLFFIKIWVDFWMKKYIITILLMSCTFSQSEENNEKQDSTFIILKSGDSIRVNKFDAGFTIQPMIEFDLKFSDFDSAKYDISEINKVADSKGKIILSKNIISIMKFIRWSCQTLISVCLIYYIIV